ncbi:ribosome maturation factor RimP [Idiomarina piscisalsi]|uniref:Ribosome maturation factor RimP n=1 Tax=Idiomarina piscisalsi TaxID=1096243 RepID=A0ABM6LU51_9GAMM|nr:ribosome maturation factor RimP [Idiomarina piscisalsi]ASG66129.1 ribosome maturation factor RimP [Idiomarina piscisalsi]MTJ01977.1 ribosome maturation factor RimP [Idiomarina piscisalsi]
MANLQERLTDIIRPAVEALDYELWGVEFVRAGKFSTLRVYIDHPNGISVDDCADVSYQVSSLLDVEDPINAEYNLEVSSPGMERPFFNTEQMVPYINETVAVQLIAAQKNKRKFQALLEAVEDDTLTLTVDDDTLQVKMRDVKSIHLVPRFD